ncbi:MAG: PIN domain-containing protein [Propionibacteriaceae bacterium]|jgi:predicted nucleic acid-binding protein|nr:PIN domain-containing protein [Propionibacteriaceae bacterium]
MSLEFVDTNVLLYAYDPADPRHEKAVALIKRLVAEDAGATSVQVLQEFYVNAVRKMGMAATDATVAITRFSNWPTFAPAAADVVAAARLSQASQLSFWDAMIVHSAAEMGCATLWSEDLNAGQSIESVTVANPF